MPHADTPFTWPRVRGCEPTFHGENRKATRAMYLTMLAAHEAEYGESTIAERYELAAAAKARAIAESAVHLRDRMRRYARRHERAAIITAKSRHRAMARRAAH